MNADETLRRLRHDFELAGPDAKEQAAAACLAAADAFTDPGARLRAARARFSLAHSTYFMADSAANRAMLEDVIARYSGDADQDIVAVVAQARLELAQDAPDARKRLAAVVRDYRYSDHPEVAHMVVNAAIRLARMRDTPDARIIELCRDMINRYGRGPLLMQPRGMAHVWEEYSLRDHTPAERVAHLDRLIAEYLALDFPKGSARSVVSLIERKADALGVDAAGLFREYAERSAAPLFIAELLDLEAERSPEPRRSEVWRDIVRRFGDSADPAVAALAAKALSRLVAAGDRDDGTLRRLDAFLANDQGVLNDSAIGMLLLGKAEAASHDSEKLALYDRILSLSTAGCETWQWIALRKKAELTGDPSCYRLFLNAMSDTDQMIQTCRELAQAEKNPDRRMLLCDIGIARYEAVPDAHPWAAMQLLGLKAQHAAEAGDAATAMRLCEQTLDIYEEKQRRFWLLPPTHAVNIMMRAARDEKERSALRDRLIARYGGASQYGEMLAFLRGE